MLLLIENGEFYAPEPRGRQAVLVLDEKVARIGEIDSRGCPSGSGDVGAVYVLDGSHISFSNLTEEQDSETTMSAFDFKLHVLSDGNRYDLVERRPEVPGRAEVKEKKSAGKSFQRHTCCNLSSPALGSSRRPVKHQERSTEGVAICP